MSDMVMSFVIKITQLCIDTHEKKTLARELGTFFQEKWHLLAYTDGWVAMNFKIFNTSLLIQHGPMHSY